MPIDLEVTGGFNQFWDDVVGQFRTEAIDEPMISGNLAGVTTHVTGTVDASTLGAQYDMPVIWSVPLNHSPAYATTTTDQGTLSVRVVVFAADVDPDTALTKARVIGGRIVDNVEGSALVDAEGNAQAARVDLVDFQLDSRPVSGQGAQVKFAELQFGIQVERPYA